MSVQKWLGGAANLLRNYGNISQGFSWRVGLKRAWSGREGSQHLACWLKMAWRGRLGSLDRLGGHDGDSSVWANRLLRTGGRNGRSTIVSWAAECGRK